MAPAFTIGLCGLSAQEITAHHYSLGPKHKSNKLRLESSFHEED